MFNSHIRQHLVTNDGSIRDTDNLFEYNSFTWKFSAGSLFFVSSRFSLGLELTLKGGGNFDVSDQVENENINNTFITREVNSAGLQILLFLGYHF